jgi:proteasome accessory factor C
MKHVNKLRELHQTFSLYRHPVSLKMLEEKIECSASTVKRLIAELRQQGAPLEYDREKNGYYYNKEFDFNLPGFWFSAEELLTLLTVQKLLSAAQPKLIGSLLKPLQNRFEKILAEDGLSGKQIAHRVRILGMAARQPTYECFKTVAAATVERKRLDIVYHGRGRNAETTRLISPQRLIHYRDNWYVDAWCHQADDLRSFAIDRIKSAKRTKQKARDVTAIVLDEKFASSYGIFSGTPKDIAVLRFSPERARWVADEQWHPQQIGKFLDDGRYDLQLPYADPRELIMDILKHGADVEVISPAALRLEVKNYIQNMQLIYK